MTTYHPPGLSLSDLRGIANQLGDLLPLLYPDAGAKLLETTEVGATLPIYLLRESSVLSGTGSIATLAIDTERWHSQIYVGGSAERFARSRRLHGNEMVVTQIWSGEIAPAMDAALNLVSLTSSGGPVMRVLHVPAYQTTGLWLVHGPPEEDEVVVALIPESFAHLTPMGRYTSSKFLEELRKEQLTTGIRFTQST